MEGNHLNGQVITGEVFLVPANGGKPISVWKSGLSHECRFSPDDCQLAIFSSEEVVLIDVATQKVLRKWARKDSLFSASFSPDGKRLAFRYWKPDEEPNGDLYLWDLAKPEPRLLYRADPKHQATDCQFTPDGKLISAYVQGKDLVYLDVESGQVAKVWKNAPWNVGVFSPDGKTYYYPDREVGVIVPYSFETGKPLAVAPDPPSRVDAIAARADGTVVGMCGTEAVIWDLTSGRVRSRTAFDMPVADMSAVALSPDGDTVLLGFPRRAFQSSLGRALALADAKTGKVTAHWESPESEIMSFEMSNSGARVALLPQMEPYDINGRRSPCNLLRVWDQNGKLGLVASSDLGWWHLALSADGRYAAAQEEKKISLWKFPDKEPVRVLSIPRGSFDILEFSPDGRTLAAIVHEYGDGNNGPTRIMT